MAPLLRQNALSNNEWTRLTSFVGPNNYLYNLRMNSAKISYANLDIKMSQEDEVGPEPAKVSLPFVIYYDTNNKFNILGDSF
jgi:hypothetical protein